jgi:hypothetical protein
MSGSSRQPRICLRGPAFRAPRNGDTMRRILNPRMPAPARLAAELRTQQTPSKSSAAAAVDSAMGVST